MSKGDGAGEKGVAVKLVTQKIQLTNNALNICIEKLMQSDAGDQHASLGDGRCRGQHRTGKVDIASGAEVYADCQRFSTS